MQGRRKAITQSNKNAAALCRTVHFEGYAMSLNIPVHFVQQFSSNIQLLLQQRGSKLRETVMTGSHVGKQASPVNQIAAVAANRVTTRFGEMPRTDAAMDRRWVFPVDYDIAQLIDTFDKLRLLADPASDYVTNAQFALGRAMDDEIVAAYFGTAQTGETGATATTFGTALTTAGGQNVSVSIGGTTSNMNVAKLREAKRRLMANEVDLDSEAITAVITATEHDALLNEAQVVSTDFNSKPVMVDGRVMQFLGINFKHCERLTTGTDDVAGTSRAIPVYAKSGMYLGVWADIATSVDVRADLQSRPWQAYATMTCGATRIEERRVVRVWCR